MTIKTTAPVFLNLFRIRFPVGAVTSIGHRIAGIWLFLSLPFWIYLLELSLAGADGYARALTILHSPWFRGALVVAAWTFFHHLFSGVRFLLLDAGAGRELRMARRSAWLVNLAGLAMAFASAGWLF